VPTSTQDSTCKEKCVPTSTQDANCKEKTCPDNKPMGSDGKCSTPCVAGTDAVCSQVTPSCVESATERCGGVAPASVLGETLGRLDVLGVSVEAPAAAVAPAALARTGGYPRTGLVEAGVILAMFGLGLTFIGRRRRLAMVDITSRLGD
jgi:hypothetical protein